MEQGSLRCDVNLSLRADAGVAPLGTRSETKNVNSLRSVERAVALRGRAPRRRSSLDGGRSILQETRHFHEDTGVDHVGPREVRRRGLPLLPRARPRARRAVARVGRGAARRTLPEPPRVRRAPAAGGVGLLRPRDARHRRRRCAGRWSRRPSRPGAAPQAARKWWLSELARRANEQGVELAALPITPGRVARIQALVDEGAINDKLARQVFDGVLAGEGTPDEVVAARGLAVVSDEGALVEAVDRAIAANPDVADKIRDGKVAAAGALIGAVMKEMRGQADAGRVRELILSKLT